MEIIRIDPPMLPCPRGRTAQITIKSFKGRKNVDVHLFRPQGDDAEDSAAWPWEALIEPGDPQSVAQTREVILESFTEEELEAIVEYIANRYGERLTALRTNALPFPLPPGIRPLRSIPEGKDIGRIRFEQVPGYRLAFPVHGLYNLAQHEPLEVPSAE